MKTIKINNIEYEIKCNALTYLYYRKIFEKNIFDDINIIREFLILQLENKETERLLERINLYIEVINRLTYSVVYTRNQNIDNYNTWIKKNQILEQDNACFVTVIEYIIDCFIDSNVSKELEKINKKTGDNTEVLFPEHHFLSACLKFNLTMKDLEFLTYIDVLKMFLCFTTKTSNERKASQADWDRLARI